MGWRLVQAVLDHCPDVTYREFRLLVALALDARDSTRLAMPGHERLALQCNCGMRSVERAMAGLKRRNLIKMTGYPAPGHRAVYKILAGPVDNPDTRQHRGGRTPVNPGEHPPNRGRTPDTSVADPLSSPSVIDQARAALIPLVTEEIAKATGRRIGPLWAARTVRLLLDGQAPGNPAAYVRAAIRRERDPRTRFLSHYGNEDQS
jgi:hypothetical protein